MRTILLFVLYVILVIILIPVFVFCYLFRTAKPLYVLGRSALRFGKWILGLRLQIDGLDGLDKKKGLCFYAQPPEFSGRPPDVYDYPS